MTGNIRQYWRELTALEQSLPEFVWLASTVVQAANGQNVVTQVAAHMAAKLLKAETHRQATEEEVAAHEAREKQSLKDAKAERMRRSGAAIVVVPPAGAKEATPEPPSPRRRR